MILLIGFDFKLDMHEREDIEGLDIVTQYYDQWIADPRRDKKSLKSRVRGKDRGLWADSGMH